MSLHTSFVLS